MHAMARIVITTFGPTGDLNPFVAPDERALFVPYYQISIESILACGARALLLNAPEMSVAPEQREDVLHVSFAPFSQVFRSCAAVIHHGRIGPIVQGLRAEVPVLAI